MGAGTVSPEEGDKKKPKKLARSANFFTLSLPYF
jgi:hypothetical protein